MFMTFDNRSIIIVSSIMIDKIALTNNHCTNIVWSSITIYNQYSKLTKDQSSLTHDQWSLTKLYRLMANKINGISKNIDVGQWFLTGVKSRWQNFIGKNQRSLIATQNPLSKNINDGQWLLKRVKSHWQTSKTIDDYCQNFNKKLEKINDHWLQHKIHWVKVNNHWLKSNDHWLKSNDQWLRINSHCIRINGHWLKITGRWQNVTDH